MPAIIIPQAESLSPAETEELAAHFTTVEQGLATFVQVGRALAAIRDKRLYRAEHKTFEAYCNHHWGIVRQTANRLIVAAEITEQLEPIGSIPRTESQCRPLAALNADDRPAAWQKAIETAPIDDDGEPVITAAHVAKIAAEIQLASRTDEQRARAEAVESAKRRASNRQVRRVSHRKSDLQRLKLILKALDEELDRFGLRIAYAEVLDLLRRDVDSLSPTRMPCSAVSSTAA